MHCVTYSKVRVLLVIWFYQKSEYCWQFDCYLHLVKNRNVYLYLVTNRNGVGSLVFIHTLVTNRNGVGNLVFIHTLSKIEVLLSVWFFCFFLINYVFIWWSQFSFQLILCRERQDHWFAGIYWIIYTTVSCLSLRDVVELGGAGCCGVGHQCFFFPNR